MSLFKTRDFWEFDCNEENSFDQFSLCIASLDGGISEKIIIASHTGFLRIFQPKVTTSDENITPAQFKATDLLLETILINPIYQVKAGKLISGSQNNQLCILHPRSIAVYNFQTKIGEIEHGNQSRLALAYEHSLKHSCYSMVLGNFGGVTGRDFLCVQSLDGVLTFFEQESFAFTAFLPQFLLPGPLAYFPFTDSFVTVSSNWQVECYRYQILAENGNKVDPDTNSGKKLTPDWIYNLGEAALDITISTISSTIHIIAVLGERNIFFLSEKGTLNTMKRLEYRPMCFSTFITEPEAKFMFMVVTDANNLMIYENTSLKWVSRLDFTPVVISRINIQELQGALVLLSDTGRLQCCYLGTEPSLFIVPSMEVRSVDFVESSKHLANLQKQIRDYARENSDALTNNASELGIKIKVSVDSELEPCTYPLAYEFRGPTPPPMCAVHVDLEPNSPLSDVHIAFNVEPPLSIGQTSYIISSLCESERITTHAFTSLFNCPVPCLDVSIAVSYHYSEAYQVVTNVVRLPLRLVFEAAIPTKESLHKLTLNVSQSPISPFELFPEFSQDTNEPSTSNALGLQLVNDNRHSVTILVAKSSQRYRIQSDSFPLLTLISEELQRRLKEQMRDAVISYQNPLPYQELNEQIDKHYKKRLISKRIEEDLGLKATQYRLIQRRMLSKYRDRTPSPLIYLDVLLKETVRTLFESAKQFDDNQIELNIARAELDCLLRLIIQLAKLIPGSQLNLIQNFEAAVIVPIADSDEEGWEDVAYAAVVHLLRTKLEKRDKHRSIPDILDENIDLTGPISNINNLKKYLATCLDRIIKTDVNKEMEKKLENISENTTMPSIAEQTEESVTNEDNLTLPSSTDAEGTIIVPAGSQIAERSVSANPHSRLSSSLSAARRVKREMPREHLESTIKEDENEEGQMHMEGDEEEAASASASAAAAAPEEPQPEQRPATAASLFNMESPPDVFPDAHDDDIW